MEQSMRERLANELRDAATLGNTQSNSEAVTEYRGRISDIAAMIEDGKPNDEIVSALDDMISGVDISSVCAEIQRLGWNAKEDGIIAALSDVRAALTDNA